jgi:hypothetical protein
MACLPLPHVTPPTLPLPLTLGLELATPTVDVVFCCNIHLPSNPLAAVSLDLLPVPTALVALISGYVDQVNAFIDSLPVSCPLD